MENEQADARRDCRTCLSRPNSEARTGTGKQYIFLVQLTTRRIGNLTRLILTLARCDDHTWKTKAGFKFHARAKGLGYSMKPHVPIKLSQVVSSRFEVRVRPRPPPAALGFIILQLLFVFISCFIICIFML